MTSLRFHLQDQVKIAPSTLPGQVDITVTLPPDVVQDYLHLLESLAGLLRFAKRKAHIAEIQAKVKSEEFAQENQRRIDEFQADLARRYDSYIDQDFTRKQAIQQITRDLKAEKHPWHFPEQVRACLIAQGRSAKLKEQRPYVMR